MSRAIHVEGLEKWYGKKQVLKGLDLKVDVGEVFALLGPNGAGKTTLIKILTGQTNGHGKVMVAGVNPLKEPVRVRKYVGIVPESESVPNYLTVEEYLQFVAELRGLKKDSVEETINKFNLDTYRKTICKNLSKGTKQRLIFAAAMMHKPRILFLDEPFINLDPVYQRVIRQILDDYINSGGTIFMATHILEMAEKLCNRVGIILDGKIVKIVDDMTNLEEKFLKEVGHAEILSH